MKYCKFIFFFFLLPLLLRPACCKRKVTNEKILRALSPASPVKCHISCKIHIFFTKLPLPTSPCVVFGVSINFSFLLTAEFPLRAREK